MFNIILTSILTFIFCIVYSMFIFGFLFAVIYGFYISIKMGKNKMINSNLVLIKHCIFFVLYLIIFVMPLLLSYIFYYKYLDMVVYGYTCGIFNFFYILDAKKRKQIIIRNYILEFSRYFDITKTNKINNFFEHYLSNGTIKKN